jgi:predicted DsbA family dithiol-disulfide isomerase
MEAEVRAAGISMVPTFIVDRQMVVVGAEDPSILAGAIRQVLAERR